MKKNRIIGLNTGELRDLFKSEGLPEYRGNQVAEWIYIKNAGDFTEMKNLPASLISSLNSQYEVGRMQIDRLQLSTDGTFKLLLELSDGEKIETVGLPYSDRFSCCLSTQAGCPIGCLFCATGKSGYKRNLTSGEIVGQILEIRKALKEEPRLISSKNRDIKNVVLMGMGEPLLNYDSTLKALKIMNNELGIGARSLTISTVGYVPGIKELMKEKLQITLAISLHAPTDDLRGHLIPGMKKWRIRESINACRDYFDFTGRRVTFEYCLLKGVNDSTAQAIQLAALIRDMNCHVNIIPFNSTSSLPFKRPELRTINDFVDVLKNEGITVTRRMEKGVDIDAACGQLKLRYK